MPLPSIFLAYEKRIGLICDPDIDANDIVFNGYFDLLPKDVPQPFAWCKQTHKDIIFTASYDALFNEEADAIITKEKNLPLLIRTADCLAVMVYDPVRHVIANIHAGWRSQSMQIVTKTLERMKQEFGSKKQDLHIYSSPSLGVCCAEFSDAYRELPSWMHAFIQGNGHVDLKTALALELQSFGLNDSQYEIDVRCTCCNPNFPSYRENGTEKRITNMFWLK